MKLLQIRRKIVRPLTTVKEFLGSMEQLNFLFLLVSIFFTVGLHTVTAQEDTTSTTTNQPLYNTLDANANTDANKNIEVKSPSGVDSVITFFAEDTMKINLKTKIAILKKDAQIEFKQQKLTAAIIEIDFNNSTLKANLVRDSAGTPIGIPSMIDAGEEFFGEELTYNIRTNTGTIKSAETRMGEGFYYGKMIKRVAKNEMYIQDGYYTTCDAPMPHYHFGSPKMKMRVGEKLFVDPLYLYVEDIPIFAIPFGLFLPMERGRRSGFIVPSFYFSNSRGVVFQNMGFYWAASDFWDTKLTTDIYSKGGFILNNSTQWALKNVFTGKGNFSFGNTRFSLDDNFAKEYKFALNHNHTFTPFENASVNLNFASQDFNRNTSTNLSQRVEQSIRSSASYSRTFENGVNTSLSLQNDQNIITEEYTGTVPLSVSVPQVRFMRKLFNIPANNWYSWLRDITFNYRGNASYNFFKRQAVNLYNSDDGTIYDTVFNTDATGFITHSPSISVTPKFGHFNINPNISFGANNFFRKIIKTYDTTSNSVLEEFQRGFFTEYYYSFGVGVSTRLYGIADSRRKFLGVIDPNVVGIKAFRHTYQPSMNFSYTPDFSTVSHNFYGRYYDIEQEREVKYSFFEREGGSRSSSSLQKRISYSDMHSFEIKRKGKDTLPDENIELLRLTFGLSHNFAADSLNFSDISSTFRTPALKIIDLSGNANFTLYDEKMTTNLRNNRMVRVNEFLLSNGKGLARLTNLGLNISTSFSSSGFIDQSQVVDITDTVDADGNVMSKELGGRFLHRDLFGRSDGDIFGENSGGYSYFSIPWSISFGLSFSYSRAFIDRIDRRLNLNTGFNFTLAESWKVSTVFQYDFINKQFITPQINLTKDFCCWALTASWYPSGFNQGFYLCFGIKSSQLRDLKIEKRDSPVFR